MNAAAIVIPAGVRKGGRKADIVERIKASSAYQHEQAATPAKHGKHHYRNGRQAGGTKRSSSESGSPVSMATKKLKGLRADDEDTIHSVFERFRGEHKDLHG